MTQSTEQERASLRAFIEMAESEGFDTAHQWYEAKGWVFFSPSTADCWRYWKAAGRAQVVSQEPAFESQAFGLHGPTGPITKFYAAAPQPPEAAAKDHDQ